MDDKSVKTGVIFALAAYSMWGIAPMYFKLLTSVPALEIVMHRIVWSVLVLCLLLIFRKKFNQVFKAIRDPKIIATLAISGLLLAMNWLVFIWAVNNDKMLDASLGYFINPLFNVLLARFFLKESLTRLQLLAVFVALAGVAFLIFSYGQLPWIALILATSFSIYGLLRKKVTVDSMPGLLIESCIMLPFALLYWLIIDTSSGNMLANSPDLNITLMLAGVVTTAPLLCFTAAARRIRYTTLGFFQYIGPSLMFLLAVIHYQEPLDATRVITFVCVWSGLFIYVYDSLRVYRKSKRII
ncbi:MAG: chloramphenicol-sensitive protein RarD [Paraglaciecola sp.]|uniref:EamA family transporter RarD n=1 Tax=uncultured Paraglaciecola sp. TaxID=1765024 RepID=UPI002600F817|nr:EamA family transporter RarD [uncultured Paraglaciecola sp.]